MGYMDTALGVSIFLIIYLIVFLFMTIEGVVLAENTMIKLLINTVEFYNILVQIF